MPRKIVGKLGWVAQGTRPDLCFGRVSISTKFQSACVKELIEAVKLTRKLKGTPKLLQHSSGMGEIKDWKLELYVDASLENLDNNKSTGGFLLLVHGRNDKRSPPIGIAGG